MTNVFPISRTSNSSKLEQSAPLTGRDCGFAFLSKDELVYTTNLINDWQGVLVHIDSLKPKSADAHRQNFVRLLNFAGVAPWRLRKEHVVKFFESKVDPETGAYLASATVASYCSSWRAFQHFMLKQERINEIGQHFNVRPFEFITEENGIGVKRDKSQWVPRGWALSAAEIDAIDAEFQFEIVQAYKSKSKSYLPLLRDRVMFHIAIHYSLRISELVTLRVSLFSASHDKALSKFGRFGGLTVTGKNNVTATVPTREQLISDLLEWYMGNVRQKILLRRKSNFDEPGVCDYDGKTYAVADLMFPSERGGIASQNAFRKRLSKMAIQAGVTARRLTPHTLRHTGCTLMVPLYSPEITQKYMRHKNLSTTLYYYHPSPLKAGNEVNAAISLFPDELEDD
ncbi:MAG: site-specific integrase [Pseudomonadota bacterium]